MLYDRTLATCEAIEVVIAFINNRTDEEIKEWSKHNLYQFMSEEFKELGKDL